MNILKKLNKIRVTTQQEQEQRKQYNGDFSIWYNFEDGDHIVRFASEFIQLRTHWIAKSDFNPITIFDPSLFEGETRLLSNINCANWDIDTETYNPDGPCVVCKLRKLASDVLRSPDKDALDEATKKEFKNLQYKCDYRKVYPWNIIDREDPQGYKLAKVGKELLNSLIELSGTYEPADFTGVEDGLDISIKKSKVDGRIKYSANIVIENGQILKTPLTEKEKSWEFVDLKKLCGQQVSQDLLVQHLIPKYKDLLSVEDDSLSATQSKKLFS